MPDDVARSDPAVIDDAEGVEYNRPDRTYALTDGVVAIAMTLLALDLKPNQNGLHSSRDLERYFGHHLGQYGSFVIAFALIAQYWSTHHALMRTVRHVSGRLTSQTMMFLFGVTLLPLSAYLSGTYANSLSTTIFAADIFLVSLALNLMGETIHGEYSRNPRAARPTS